MNVYNQMDFVNRLFLRDARKFSKGINFKHMCPHGLDKKRRGYVLFDHEKVTVYCQRCGMNTSLKKYLELNEPALYQEFVLIEKQEFLENITQGKLTAKKQDYSHINSGIKDLSLFKLNTKYFILATESNECIEYCKKRKIDPTNLKFCTHPSNICSGMLIFPCYWKDGEHVYAFQGRSIQEGTKRFYTHSKNDSFKVDGIFQVDLDKPVYIFESIIDRLSKSNSVAAMGCDLSPQVLSMIKHPVFCLDRDLAGMKKTLRYVEAGHKVFIWGNEIRAKDCNELVAKWNWTNEQIDKMITSNVYSGIAAIARLKIQMRNRKR